ncbi:DgyrCDS8113 [Dimorphilus gyrociliatus]|uniref:DgyrCDS8113 n=1 Tax=Dimorphilus gyrociliatus TaxID=2664684 RepID=A0A7I8VU83_9ANNE|nr:DgyrCDS8113 [Dimorphilus gyrociliatus]
MDLNKFIIERVNPEKSIVIGRPFRLNIVIDTIISLYVKGFEIVLYLEVITNVESINGPHNPDDIIKGRGRIIKSIIDKKYIIRDESEDSLRLLREGETNWQIEFLIPEDNPQTIVTDDSRGSIKYKVECSISNVDDLTRTSCKYLDVISPKSIEIQSKKNYSYTFEYFPNNLINRNGNIKIAFENRNLFLPGSTVNFHGFIHNTSGLKIKKVLVQLISIFKYTFGANFLCYDRQNDKLNAYDTSEHLPSNLELFRGPNWTRETVLSSFEFNDISNGALTNFEEALLVPHDSIPSKVLEGQSLITHDYFIRIETHFQQGVIKHDKKKLINHQVIISNNFNEELEEFPPLYTSPTDCCRLEPLFTC